MTSTGNLRLLVEVDGHGRVHTTGEHTTLSAFIEEIVEKFIVNYEFNISIYDNDFETYVLLEDLSQLENKARLKIQKIDKTKEQSFQIHDQTETNNNESTEPVSSPINLDDVSKSKSQNEVKIDAARNLWHLTYTLPKFPTSLETALTNDGIITATHKDMIMTLIYGDISMPSNFYPKGAQYDVVINLLLDKYPKLYEKIGRASALDLWRRKLQNKFRNCRSKDGASNIYVLSRKLKRSLNTEDGETSSPSEKRQRLNSIWGLENYLPEYDAGENKQTCLKHKEVLQTLSKEKFPDQRKVCFYMERTFALRRQEIVHEQLSSKEVIKNYPFLNDKAEMILEIRRIMGEKYVSYRTFCDSLRSQFGPVKHLYYKQRKRKDHPSMKEIIQKYELARLPEEYIEMEIIMVFYYVALLLRESGEQIVFAYEENVENRPPVYIDQIGENDFELIIEGVKIENINSLSLALYLFFCSFYIYNLKYQKKSDKTCEFMQRKILKIADNQRPSTLVLNIINALAEINQ